MVFTTSDSMRTAPLSVAAAALMGVAHAQHTMNEWKSRSIYQTMTDRFARTDGATTDAPTCVLYDYCNGTWKGLIDHLDYIQGTSYLDDRSHRCHGT